MEEEEASWVTASSFRTSCSAVPFEVDYAVYEKKIYLLNKNYRDFKLYLQCEKFPHLFHFSRGGQCMGVHKTHANKDPHTHTHTHTHTCTHHTHTHTHTHTTNFTYNFFNFIIFLLFLLCIEKKRANLIFIIYAHTYIHPPTHPHTHTHTHIQRILLTTFSISSTFSFVCIEKKKSKFDIHICTHICTHAHTHTHTHTHVHTYTHIHVRTHAHAHTCTYTRTHIYMCTHAHTCTL